MNTTVWLFSTDFPEIQEILNSEDIISLWNFNLLEFSRDKKVLSSEVREKITSHLEPFLWLEVYGLRQNSLDYNLWEKLSFIKSKKFDELVENHPNPKLKLFREAIKHKYSITYISGEKPYYSSATILWVNKVSTDEYEKVQSYLDIRNKLFDLEQTDFDEFYNIIKKRINISWSKKTANKVIDLILCEATRFLKFVKYSKKRGVEKIESYYSHNSDSKYETDILESSLFKKINNIWQKLCEYIEELCLLYLDNYDEIIKDIVKEYWDDLPENILSIFGPVFFSTINIYFFYTIKSAKTFYQKEWISRPVYSFYTFYFDQSILDENNLNESIERLEKTKRSLKELNFFQYFDSSILKRLQEIKAKFLTFIDYDLNKISYDFDNNYLQIFYKNRIKSSHKWDFIEFSSYLNIFYDSYLNKSLTNNYIKYYIVNQIKSNPNIKQILSYVIWSNNINNSDFLDTLPENDQKIWKSLWFFTYF